MESIRKIYRAGTGPSSSHTMGPERAARDFLAEFPGASSYSVTLYGSLASTGKGHLTDLALKSVIPGVEIEWQPDKELPLHPNGMEFRALAADGSVVGEKQIYSVGGGELMTEGDEKEREHLYPERCMEDILKFCMDSGLTFWEYVESREDKTLNMFIEEVWDIMTGAVKRGLSTEGVLPGGLGLARKALSVYRKTSMTGQHMKRTGLLSAYALAVAEENAAGGRIVTAPTCGSCGVVPSVIYYLNRKLKPGTTAIIRALETAGLIGNVVKYNASISGAQVGCQGEIGTACSMAASAAAQLLGGTVRQIEYAAEMGLEHHLGLTCDPVNGLVQIPCIERNAFAAARALTCADYALFSDGNHRISFDQVVSVMKETGNNLPSLYRETSTGGLAAAYRKKKA